MNSDEKQFGAPWWQKMLSRREANKNIAKIGALAFLLSAAGINSGCDEDEDDIEVDKDTFELQKEQGWNIGATDKTLQFTGKCNNDSQGSMDWMTYLDPIKLLSAYRPNNQALQPFVVPTLVQSLSQTTLKSQMAPVITNEMKEAYSRGLGMREILLKTKEASKMCLMVDIKGPEAVAYAAALADVADPVITFDNWPHPLGVVPSHMTLGALIFYAKEVEAKAKVRKDDAASVFILDANRLSSYTDADKQFDNRYIAKLPPADKLTALNISNIIYSVPNENRQVESDDINDDFATYKDKGINVSMLPLSNFQPSNGPNEQKPTPGRAGEYVNNYNVYHYGGGGSYMPYFFMYYAFMRPGYGYYIPHRLPPTSLPRPSYTPARRPTMFSSSTVGGGRGVGKMKPSGFGRVSTRMSSDGRSVTGIRSGRSGSFGRSRGGRFGG